MGFLSLEDEVEVNQDTVCFFLHISLLSIFWGGETRKTSNWYVRTVVCILSIALFIFELNLTCFLLSVRIVRT